MKKRTAIVLALLLALVAVFTLAAADEEADYAERYPESLIFDSEWAAEECHARIDCEDGGFRITVTQTAEYPNGYCWQYSALYNAENKTLESVSGSLDTITWREDGGFDLGDTVYEDGEATFAINEKGRLIWNDAKENAGEGVAFEKIGWFNGSKWTCDRADIEMDWEEEGYRVRVSWSSSAWETTEWAYSCFYDAATNTLSGMLGSKTDFTYDDNGNVVSWEEVYNDGEVTFSLDENGNLLWNDEKENAGEGMVFERDIF